MLIVTGVLLGVVLMVMVGESIQEMQLAGWIPIAQALARIVVAGSYLLAEHVRVRRQRRRASGPRSGPRRPPTPSRRRSARPSRYAGAGRRSGPGHGLCADR
jgi:high-affinity iron transporter